MLPENSQERPINEIRRRGFDSDETPQQGHAERICVIRRTVIAFEGRSGAYSSALSSSSLPPAKPLVVSESFRGAPLPATNQEERSVAIKPGTVTKP